MKALLIPARFALISQKGVISFEILARENEKLNSIAASAHNKARRCGKRVSTETDKDLGSYGAIRIWVIQD